MRRRRSKPARCYVTVKDTRTGDTRSLSIRHLTRGQVLSLLRRGDARSNRAEPADRGPSACGHRHETNITAAP